MKSEKWLNVNMAYWNGLAKKYNLLYNDLWSLKENGFIANKLRSILHKGTSEVLDLGCGTGLGYSLCESINPKIKYTGLDISAEMLGILKTDFPSAIVIQGQMSNLTMIESDSLDAIISIFTSFSYTDNIELTVQEMARVLKPDGRIIISVLSRYSLRRLLSFKFGELEQYRSRGTNSKEFSEAWDFTQRNLFLAFHNQGFGNIKIVGYNPLSGFALLTKLCPMLWGVNLKIAKLLPFLSHELILTSQIKK